MKVQKAKKLTKELTNKIREKYYDCWSPAERRLKHVFETIKKYVFYPFLGLFSWLRISANMISYASAMCGLIATYYMWIDMHQAAIFLIVSVVLDGIDGSLARFTHQSSPQGSLTDAFTDQVTISATTIGMIANGVIDIVWGGVYLVLYPVLILFSILKNSLGTPNQYVFRPRFIMYVFFLWYVYSGQNIINYALIPVVLVLMSYVLYDFFTLKKVIR